MRCRGDGLYIHTDRFACSGKGKRDSGIEFMAVMKAVTHFLCFADQGSTIFLAHSLLPYKKRTSKCDNSKTVENFYKRL